MEEIKAESAPDWAMFLAQDGDGVWYWHANKPKPNGATVCGEGYWISTGESCIACRGELIGDWRDALEKRPEEFQPFTSIEDNQEQQVKQDNGWFERGELPPVGARCIALQGIAPKANCEVIAKTTQQIVVRWEENGLMDVIDLDLHVAFRPIRTERELEIEEMKQACPYHGCWDQVGRIYAEALYDAGYRKEAK